MKKLSRSLLALIFGLIVFSSKACQCPLTTLGMAECDKYEIIFKGKILSVISCDHKFGEAMFEIEELYKGTVAKKFKVLFECKVECAMQFNVGEEWIIYSKYKQVDNAMMNWCSRSRKYFKNEKEDFYTVNYGNDYYDEVKFLRERLGIHRFLVEKNTADENRNIAPTQNQVILILLCSISTIVLFYWLFNKFFK
jgi:hypothetical protein